MMEVIASGFGEPIIVAFIAAGALVLGAAATQSLNYIYQEKHIILNNLRGHFVLQRTDAILTWGQAMEKAFLATTSIEVVEFLKLTRLLYVSAACAAGRQDIILGTKWKQCINEVHGIVESAIEAQENPEDIVRILANCEMDVSNFLNEVEWWRLFLLFNPMPSRMQVLLRKWFSYGWFGPNKFQ